MLRHDVTISPWEILMIPPSPGTAEKTSRTTSSMYFATPGCDAHIVPIRSS